MAEKKEQVGAFWKKTLADGRVLYGGHVNHKGEKIQLTLWVNDKQGIEKRPDLTAYLDTFEPKK